MKTPLFIEQHFHGCYGINFNTARVNDILELSHSMLKEGVGYIFPTLVTDSIENTKRQIQVIKDAAGKQTSDMAKICGVHLEGIFLNPAKKGIHDEKYFMQPTVENYQLLEDEFIKIVTLAPELCIEPTLSYPSSTRGEGIIKYLRSKGVKVQAGHCIGGSLSGCDGVTHMFNAMSGVTHRGESTALTALIKDNIFTEVIADGVHVSDDALKLLFKTKQMTQILLISDCLPCTHSDVKEFNFAGSKVYFDGVKATSADGTIAGSTKLLPDIIKILGKKDLLNRQYISNSYTYHGLVPSGEIEWDDDYNIVKISY